MKGFSIRFKLLVGAAIIILLSLGVVIFLAVRSFSNAIDVTSQDTRKVLQNNIDETLSLAAKQIQADITQRLQSGFDSAHALAKFFGSTAHSEAQITRPAAKALVRAQLDANPQVSSMYAEFETNGYDGQDSLFQGELAHSSNNGTLELYWVREETGLTFYPIEDSTSKYDTTINKSGIREGEWYLRPFETKQDSLIEPYLFEIEPGRTILMTSLTVPILHEGNVIGVAGTDLNLPVLQTFVEQLAEKLYNGQVQITLLSAKQRVIASTQFPEKIGNQPPASFIAKASQRPEEHTESIFIEQSIDISGSQWKVFIEVPKKVALAKLNQIKQDIEANQQTTTRNLLLLSAVILVATLILVNFFISGITKPLAILGKRMQALGGAEGDLTYKLEESNHLEINEIAIGFNSFTDKIRTLVIELVALSEQLKGNSRSLAKTASETRVSTDDQQIQLQNVATAANEMSTAATDVAGLAGQTAQNVSQSEGELGEAKSTLQLTVNEITGMSSALDQASDSISHVAKRSDAIYSIIETISDIAEQTNLLALNAAIEAARAGDQGRGFAVVADEVRSLASRTQSATGDIDTLISSLKHDVDQSVKQMRDCQEKANTTVTHSQSSYQRLEDISAQMSAISQNTVQVATAAEEQSMVNEEINRNITQIGNSADVLSHAATQVKNLSEEVADSAEQLGEQLARFKV